MGPSHDFGRPRRLDRRRSRRRLALTIAFTALIMVVEVAGGFWANSLALLSDAGHMLTDVLALAMALFAITVATRPATARKTYGYHRVEILSALTNGLLLTIIAIAIFLEARARLLDPEPVNARVVLVVAAVGLVANLIAVLLLRHGRSVNVRAARWHVLGDALSSGGVLLGGIAIWATSWYRLDAILSCAIAVVILLGAFRILRETVDILLEATPRGLHQEDVRCAIEEIDGIRGVHDLHIWSITSGMTALSGHVTLDSATLARSDELLNRVKTMLHERFEITHTTIQVESESYDEVGEIH